MIHNMELGHSNLAQIVLIQAQGLYKISLEWISTLHYHWKISAHNLLQCSPFEEYEQLISICFLECKGVKEVLLIHWIFQKQISHIINVSNYNGIVRLNLHIVITQPIHSVRPNYKISCFEFQIMNVISLFYNLFAPAELLPSVASQPISLAFAWIVKSISRTCRFHLACRISVSH